MTTSSPDTPLQGLFITFEGLDGSGKTTQMSLCAEALSKMGYSVVLTRNPGGTEFGQELREILLHYPKSVYPISELLLFVADRAQHMDEVVFPALRQGQVVLCDRHMDSTVAYQGYGRNLPLETIQTLNHIAIQGRKPDVTLLFDGSPEILSQRVTKRGKADRMESEVHEFHVRVRRGFLALAEAEPERIQVFNALEAPQAQHEQVMRILWPLLGKNVLKRTVPPENSVSS